MRLRLGCWAWVGLAACAVGEGARTDEAGEGEATLGSSTTIDGTLTGPGDSAPTDDGVDATPTSLTNADDDEGMGPAECGNGNMDPNELCDDANEVDADGCNSDCIPSGYVVWQETVGSALAQVDEGFGIVADGDGNFFVAGYTATAAGTVDGWLRRLSPKGGAYWTDTLQGAGAGNDALQGIALAEDNGVYVAGYESAADMTNNGWVRKIDRFGAELWTNSFDAPGATATVVQRMAIDPEGSVLVVGYHDLAAEGQNLMVRKYTVDGMPVWTRSYNGSADGNDYGYGIAAANDGHIYVAGSESVAGEGLNIWLGKYDTDGNLVWSRSYNGQASLDDYLMDVEVDGDGNAFVCGHEGATLYPWQVFVRRYDAAGTIVWTDKYAGLTELGAHCHALARDSVGDLVITGGENRDMVRDVLVRKYSPDGDVKWTTLVPGGAMGPDYGRDVFVDADRLIYATGAIDTGVDVRDIWMARISP